MRKYILIILISFFTSFGLITFNHMNGYCADTAITMGSSGAEILNGVGGAFSNLFDVGIGFDPVSISVNLSNAYDQINASMYQNFGWDLEDAQYWLADNVYGGLDSIAVNTIASALNMDWASLAYQGYKLYSTDSLDGVKNLVIGKVVEGGAEFADVVDNALVYIDDNLISKFRTVKEDLIVDDVLKNFSELNGFGYGDHFRFHTVDRWGEDVVFILNFESNVCITSTTSGNTICVISPYNVNQTIPCTGSRIYGGDEITQVLSAGIDGSSYVFQCVMNGVTYYGAPLTVKLPSGSSVFVEDEHVWGRIVDTTETLNGSNISQSAIAYNNNALGYSAVSQLLDRLSGHWVTTDQLERIEDIISDLAITVSLDGETANPVWEWDQDIVDSLTAVIDGIIADNAVIDDSLGADPDPGPPDNNTNQGISVFPDFPIPVLDNFTTILGMPTQFFSIFRPLFLIFGSYFNPLWSFWLFIPSCVVIGFIIWLIH